MSVYVCRCGGGARFAFRNEKGKYLWAYFILN